jgi:hypothetical protein
VSDPAKPLIRHVRYEDFIALASAGVRDLAGFKATVDRLVAEMGAPHHHHVLFDLRGATLPPLPEAVLIEAISYLASKGVGEVNKLAIVVDPADPVRPDRMQVAERIATLMGLHIRGFADYGEALDWLSDPNPEA